MASTTIPAATDTGERVSSLELFFDLVFVFTITQLTNLLAREPSWTGIMQATLIFGNVWWMYGGYAWLTNAVPPRELGVRLLLLVGMGGFLMVALSIPTAFSGGGAAFGIGYLIVTLVHTGVFLRVSQQSVLKAMMGLGPFNIITAALLLAGGLTAGSTRVVLFAAGFVLHWITPFITRTGGFRIRAGHFVERHGLILLIAIGESVVAVGIGLGTIDLPAGRIVTALLGLALAATLWWLYFNGEEQRAETALARAPQERAPWLALNAFGYTFLLILGGIVLAAAGMKLAVVRYQEPATVATALFLAAGVSVYLLGLAVFRWLVRGGSSAVRLGLAAVVLPTAFIGLGVSPFAQLVLLVLILVVGSSVDSLTQRTGPAPPDTDY
ncbi:MAG TPA: low temperature requirement protein A [Candidatus Dormibacteraeota bacterium]|nr:low temperature requirement protein A [Candidatus Dormibacteraeota bacterium]